MMPNCGGNSSSEYRSPRLESHILNTAFVVSDFALNGEHEPSKRIQRERAYR